MKRIGSAGDATYDAYVGPPDQYDFMGATQFRLLTSFGLREHHKTLDVGCGSLRLGRLLLPYLGTGNYFGIEPNDWLIKDAITKEIGVNQIELKKPIFDYNSNFTIPFNNEFDFIIAQSIFSHTGVSLFESAMRNISKALKYNGFFFATFYQNEAEAYDTSWYYPGCVGIKHKTIMRIARDNDLHCRKLKWFHPRQTWYVFSKNKNRIPSYIKLRRFTGDILNCPKLIESKQSEMLRVRRAKQRNILRKIWRIFKRCMPARIVRWAEGHVIRAWKN